MCIRDSHKIGGVDPVVTVHNLKVFADGIANAAVNGGAVTAVFLLDNSECIGVLIGVLLAYFCGVIL